MVWFASLMVVKHWPKSTCRVKGFFLFSCFSLFSREAKAGTQGKDLKAGTWKQGLKQKPWRNTAYYLSCLSLLIYFSYTTQVYLPRVACPHGSGPSCFNQQLRKYPYRYVHWPIWWRNFVNWGSFFPRLCQVGNSNHRCFWCIIMSLRHQRSSFHLW